MKRNYLVHYVTFDESHCSKILEGPLVINYDALCEWDLELTNCDVILSFSPMDIIE